MISRLVQIALRQRLLVVIAAVCAAVWGAVSYRSMSIDAFPDVSPVQVLVSMRAPGLTPEELETRVTNPVEIAVRGIPNLERMRSTTRYSVTLMTFEFAAGTDIFWARAQVNERLQEVRDQLPAGTSGGLAPIVTPLAEMLMFTLRTETLSLEQQRTFIDWVVRPALRGLPGVADINVLGGEVRNYEVVPNAPAMAARGITTQMLEGALVANNRNDGAGRVRSGEEALLVRSEGRIRTLDDIRNTVVATKDSRIVRVSDIADVRNSAMPRNGVVTQNGEGEAIWVLVLGLRGANAETVVTGVKARLEQLKQQMPGDTHVDIFYDRSELIGKAVWTVQKVLLEAIVLVLLLLLLFLGNLRAALVVAMILPLAVLATFGIMKAYGLTANIMSLGGLAIAIGLLVDCAVVIVENVEHRLAHLKDPDIKTRLRVTRDAVKEVAPPLVSGVAIIITVFLPLLSLQGLEGRLFGPVALTIGFALAAALVLSLTVVPAIAASVLNAGVEHQPWLVRRLHALYDPLLERVIQRPLLVVVPVIAGLLAAVAVYPRIGSTFLPVMDEGTPVVTVRKHPTISIEETAQVDLRIQQHLLERVPEIRRVIARAGADDLGLDPVGLNESDMFFTLAPQSTWRRYDKAWLMEEIRKALSEVPGITFAFAQPIDMRVQEMIIGARGDVVVKVFGDDIDQLNRLASAIGSEIKKVPGSADVFALRNEGLRYLTVTVDRNKAGRFGLNAVDVQDAIRVWVDGRQIGVVLEGNRRIPIAIRGEADLRVSAAALSRVPVVLPAGGTVELAQIADVRADDGPIQVIRENGQRFATVLANVRGRDLVGFVNDAKAAVGASVVVPPGFSLEWGGQFENQQRASARLAIVVPIALAAIFLLLYMTFGSVRQAILVFCNVPFATIGGVIALWASGELLSVPASVGFIALIGIAVLNGVVLISCINEIIEDGTHTFQQAVIEGTKRRLRPVMLTAAIAALGLVPFLFATGPGAEIQRPLAIVVIGGLVTATSLTLLLLPILYDRFAVRASARQIIEAREQGMSVSASGAATPRLQSIVSRVSDWLVRRAASVRSVVPNAKARPLRSGSAGEPLSGKAPDGPRDHGAAAGVERPSEKADA